MDISQTFRNDIEGYSKLLHERVDAIRTSYKEAIKSGNLNEAYSNLLVLRLIIQENSNFLSSTLPIVNGIALKYSSNDQITKVLWALQKTTKESVAKSKKLEQFVQEYIDKFWNVNCK